MDITNELSFNSPEYVETCELMLNNLNEELNFSDNDSWEEKKFMQAYELWKEANQELEQLQTTISKISKKLKDKSEEYHEESETSKNVENLLLNTIEMKESKEKELDGLKKMINNMNSIFEAENKSQQELLSKSSIAPILLQRIRNLVSRKQRKISLINLPIEFIVYYWIKSDIFRSVNVSKVENAFDRVKQLTIFYKHAIGPYQKVGKYFCEIDSLVPKGVPTVGIYYDDPQVVPSEICQAAVGCIYAFDNQVLFDESACERLKQKGYEQKVIPAPGSAVHTRQLFNTMLCIFRLIWFSYPAIKKFVKKNELEVQLALEVCKVQPDGNRYVDIYMPIGAANGYYVKEHLNPQDLEEKLSISRSDSEPETQSEKELSQNDLEEEERE
uniref:Uncharacterized protein n=1 Tax=Acrobeloides nanus TaxID=290746 RepID=A0A914C687_9BILA